MPVTPCEGLVSAENAEHRHAERLEGAAESLLVSVRADPVEDDGAKGNVGRPGRKSVHEGCDGLVQLGSVDDKHDWCTGERRHRGGAGDGE